MSFNSRWSLRPLTLLIVALVLGSCKSLPLKEQPDYGLRRVSLRTSAEDAGLLNGQILSKRPVKAAIDIAGALQVNCNISYAGRGTLNDYRKSFDLNLCDARFNDRRSYRVSGQSYDPSMLRALLSYPLYAALELEVPKVEPAALYINSQFVGLYLLTETIDDNYFSIRGYDTGVVYKARYGNSGFKPEFASRLPEAFSVETEEDDYTFLRALYQITLAASDEAFFVTEISRLLDVDSFLRYAAASLYACQWDGMHNNYFLILDRSRGKLIMAPWDMDRTWEKTASWTPEELISLNQILVRLLRSEGPRLRLRELLVQLQTEYPLHRIQADVDRWSELTAEAYTNDVVLSTRPHAEVRAELMQDIEVWLEKLKIFTDSLASAS